MLYALFIRSARYLNCIKDQLLIIGSWHYLLHYYNGAKMKYIVVGFKVFMVAAGSTSIESHSFCCNAAINASLSRGFDAATLLDVMLNSLPDLISEGKKSHILVNM